MATKDLTAAAPKDADFKVPKTLAQCADMLYECRQARYKLQKEVEAIARREAVLRDHLINNLPKSQAVGVAGKLARATIVNKDVVTVTDWTQVYDYILKHARKNPGVWSLMQRRIGDSAVKEMHAANKDVPGTDIIQVPDVSLNKLS